VDFGDVEREQSRTEAGKLSTGALHDTDVDRALSLRSLVVEVVVLDLDDTLYAERDYVRSGFEAVAEQMADDYGLEAHALAEQMNEVFDRNPAADVFSALLHDDHVDCSLEEMIECYRGHLPRISLFPDAVEVMKNLRLDGYRLALITDGDVARQTKKIEALAIRDYFDSVLVTGELGRDFWKPHPRAFELTAERLGVRADSGSLAYVGDNPLKDFLAPNRMGWTTIRVRMRQQIRFGLEPPTAEFASDHNCSSLTELRACLLGS
jgi:putative hydrolase of the HAD superfamily